MLVKHRNQQRLQGVITPIKDRKCSACRQEFKSKGGLISHQSRTTNPLCRRAGKIRMGSEWAKKAKNRFWEKKKVFQLKDSLFSKHSRGKPITKEEKKILCNVFQSFYDENGHNKDRAIKKTSKVCGFSVRAIAQIVKERAVSGTVIGNVNFILPFCAKVINTECPNKVRMKEISNWH